MWRRIREGVSRGEDQDQAANHNAEHTTVHSKLLLAQIAAGEQQVSGL
jgi:hypothetical protein